MTQEQLPASVSDAPPVGKVCFPAATVLTQRPLCMHAEAPAPGKLHTLCQDTAGARGSRLFGASETDAARRVRCRAS